MPRLDFGKNPIDSTNLFLCVVNDDLYEITNYYNYYTREHVDAKKDDYRNSLLHIAILFSRDKIVDYLLSKNASLDITNLMNETPNDIAVLYRNKKMICKLLDHKMKAIHKKVEDLEFESNRLAKDVKYFESQNTNLKNELVVVNNDKKRLRDENSDLNQANKRLKIDIKTYQKMIAK
jgi:ankyrin repeat protein